MKYFLASVAMFISFAASAGDCPGGSASTDGCQKLLAPLERQLAAAEKAAELKLAASLRENGPEYVTEAVKALRESSQAWRKLRDSECWYQALKDGMSMSPDYASPVAAACKVDRTRDRILWVAK
jgi:uncharacterized protein YecT (DUF1311 family)